MIDLPLLVSAEFVKPPCSSLGPLFLFDHLVFLLFFLPLLLKRGSAPPGVGCPWILKPPLVSSPPSSSTFRSVVMGERDRERQRERERERERKSFK